MKDIANLLASISALLGPVPIIITAVTSLIVSIRSRTQQIKGARLSILPGGCFVTPKKLFSEPQNTLG